MASKNNPDERNKPKVIEKWTLYVGDGKRKMCKVIDNKLVDKQGNVVATY